MKFGNPQWLWVLAALPLTYFLLSWDERRRKRQFARFVAPAVWARVAPEADSRARLRKARVWVLGMAFVIAALARPQWGSHEEVVKVSGLDIMVVLDVSNSMEVEDIVPNRLKKAKHIVKAFSERLHGDRMGAVAFAGSAFLSSPLTTDLDYLAENVSILNPKMVTNQGTDIGIGLETARKALERGAEEVRPSGAPGEPAPNSSRAIVLISDGEDHEQGALEEAKLLKQAGIKTYVIGVGTEKGGPIPVRDESGNLQGYKRDRGQQPVVSSFKPDALMQVASAAGGRYWNATTAEGEVEEILQDLGALNRTDYAERRYLVFEDRFQIPLAIGILILLLEISLPARKVSSKDRLAQRREHEAAFARIALPLFAIGALGSAQAQAAPILGKQPPLDVYIDNEKGLKAYRNGDVDQAKKEFGSAQAKDPSLPELQFNRGVVQLKEGDLDGSIEAFANAATAARGTSGAKAPPDEKLAGQSFYNLGQALAKKGELGKAVASYVESIRSAQASGDSSLEQDARKNIELLVQQQQKQKQQQQQQQQDQKQQEQQKQDQKQQQQKQEQDQKDKQEQAKQYQDPKKRKQFKSEKLSPEDAERVMAELAGKERELQTKLKQQHGNAGNSTKDW